MITSAAPRARIRRAVSASRTASSAAIGIGAALALLNRRPSAVAIARWSLIASAATDVFVYTTPFFPNNRMPGDTPFYLAGSLAYHGAWLVYLARSTRVRSTFA